MGTPKKIFKLSHLRIIPGALILLAIGTGFYLYGRSLWVPVYRKIRGNRTVESVLREYGHLVEQRLTPYFRENGISYPPSRITLIALKNEKRLEVWASDGDVWRHIRDYPILAASGGPGPKLRRGDGQVPEGLYRIEGLNPNSSYHLSMKLDYPNTFDRKQASADGRTDPGDNIFIHGKAVSIGCLAIGDDAITDLFVLTAQSGLSNISVIIAPNDLRILPPPPSTKDHKIPAWTTELYDQIQREIAPFTEMGFGKR